MAVVRLKKGRIERIDKALTNNSLNTTQKKNQATYEGPWVQLRQRYFPSPGKTAELKNKAQFIHKLVDIFAHYKNLHFPPHSLACERRQWILHFLTKFPAAVGELFSDLEPSCQVLEFDEFIAGAPPLALQTLLTSVAIQNEQQLKHKHKLQQVLAQACLVGSQAKAFAPFQASPPKASFHLKMHNAFERTQTRHRLEQSVFHLHQAIVQTNAQIVVLKRKKECQSTSTAKMFCALEQLKEQLCEPIGNSQVVQRCLQDLKSLSLTVWHKATTMVKTFDLRAIDGLMRDLLSDDENTLDFDLTALNLTKEVLLKTENFFKEILEELNKISLDKFAAKKFKALEIKINNFFMFLRDSKKTHHHYYNNPAAKLILNRFYCADFQPKLQEDILHNFFESQPNYPVITKNVLLFRNKLITNQKNAFFYLYKSLQNFFLLNKKNIEQNSIKLVDIRFLNTNEISRFKRHKKNIREAIRFLCPKGFVDKRKFQQIEDYLIEQGVIANPPYEIDQTSGVRESAFIQFMQGKPIEFLMFNLGPDKTAVNRGIQLKKHNFYFTELKNTFQKRIQEKTTHLSEDVLRALTDMQRMHSLRELSFTKHSPYFVGDKVFHTNQMIATLCAACGVSFSCGANNEQDQRSINAKTFANLTAAVFAHRQRTAHLAGQQLNPRKLSFLSFSLENDVEKEIARGIFEHTLLNQHKFSKKTPVTSFFVGLTHLLKQAYDHHPSAYAAIKTFSNNLFYKIK